MLGSVPSLVASLMVFAMTAPDKPPVTATQHPLPFQSLQPGDFERFCLWLISREGFERVEHLGSLGYDHGCDILAMRGSELWAFQCKRVSRFGAYEATKEIDKILALPAERLPSVFVFIVTCLVSAQARQIIRDRCAGKLHCIFWARTELDEKVSRHPDLLRAFFLAAPEQKEDSLVTSERLSQGEQIQHLLSRIDHLISLHIQHSPPDFSDKVGPLRAHLLISDAHGSPIMYEHITSTSITVGRGSGSMIKIPDPELSSTHLRIEIKGVFIYITDLGSANGTRVNDKLITKRTVTRLGDKISIGNHILILYPPSPDKYSTTPETSRPSDASKA